jgi:hypothetical protein
VVGACGLDGFREGHQRRDGGESPHQHRLAWPRGTEQEDILVGTPALPSALHPCLELVLGKTAAVASECDERW